MYNNLGCLHVHAVHTHTHAHTHIRIHTATMIRGNHGNCRVFATEQWLGEFMKQLSLPCYTHSVLDVIQCLLSDSPEVLNLFSPRDIATIVNILNTSGRDEKVN